jgi:hypothetical protein
VSLTGGSGPFGPPFDVTWNTLEDNLINGSVTISGYNGFWQGFFRNTVNERPVRGRLKLAGR